MKKIVILALALLSFAGIASEAFAQSGKTLHFPIVARTSRPADLHPHLLLTSPWARFRPSPSPSIPIHFPSTPKIACNISSIDRNTFRIAI